MLRAETQTPFMFGGVLALRGTKINKVEGPAEEPEARLGALKETAFLDRPYPRVRPRVERGEDSEAMRVKDFVKRYRVLRPNDHMRRPVNLSGGF